MPLTQFEQSLFPCEYSVFPGLVKTLVCDLAAISPYRTGRAGPTTGPAQAL